MKEIMLMKLVKFLTKMLKRSNQKNRLINDKNMKDDSFFILNAHVSYLNVDKIYMFIMYKEEFKRL